MIKIFNVRDGFANNSSSTHSIIFRLDDKNVDDNYSDDFGWDYFTVNSKNGVNDYLKGILYSNLSYNLSHDYIEAIVDSWVGPHDWSQEVPTVDHQSCITLPLRYNEKGINKQFFNEIKELFLNSNTLILGGNDNDDESHVLSDTKGIQPSFMADRSNHRLIAKYDEEYEYWTIFDRNSGFKLRCIINENGEQIIVPKRASTPDLADLKISDYCEFGCQFCYMGSTKDGKHAARNELDHIIRTLAQHQTLEIAFGGGEPTLYPDFKDLLRYTRDQNIVPNFTTKNIQWLRDNIQDIAHIIGSCAVSVSHATDVKKIRTILDFYNIPSDKICAQVVVGAYHEATFEAIVKACIENHITLTLLGFKTNGRGATFKQQSNNWFDIVTKELAGRTYYKVGVDTALVQQYEQLLKDKGVPQWLYHKDEGVFSWYINAVDKRMGISSYNETKPYKHFSSEFLGEFNK